ncbi:MAG: hypothetical protein GFH27_549291n329 [Chloroflexi bacterium AL-W]|nr:hypothetical protein [Chloroflexi bacterium AL-N1]NOK67203.1 hypothetical protein [Chloroflexi bacterium AL-N10]NOK75303.1 hypothetical protein [Chloroflexi bacterium AL-N5]NOK82091.1 hypothetical protein [Chloroflexi bacterium AL-W]NOK89936.1 hypothetical protein [Chloroflexi bacterium AL-N15]
MAYQHATIDGVLSDLLSRFQSASLGITGSLIVDSDGFVIASNLPNGGEERRIAGIGAALIALGEQVVGELHHGQLKRAFIEGDDGYVTAINLSAEAALIVLAHRHAKPGLVFSQMERAAVSIRKIMKL